MLLMPAMAHSASWIVWPGENPQAAIDLAANGDEIAVSAGTYNVHLDFKGKNVKLKSLNPYNPDTVAATILDGTNTGTVVTFSNGEGAGAILTGFTIRNGNAQNGGGVYISGASPTITKNVITGCTAHSAINTGGGGGLVAVSGSPAISYNTFTNNTADANGGSVSMVSCGGIFMNNSISGGTATNGGGVAIYGGTVNVLYCTFTNNAATAEGGALYCSGASTAYMAGNTLSANTANHGGGIFCNSTSVAQMACNLIHHNTGLDSGGGAFLFSTSPIFALNTVVANNSGVYTYNCNVNIDSCIIANNTGVGVVDWATQGTSVTYSDLWGNSPNTIGAITLGAGCFSQDPLFANPGGNDFRLKSREGRWNGSVWVTDAVSSPCIDTGNPGIGWDNEPVPNGSRANMGYDGDSMYASKTWLPMIALSNPVDSAIDVSRRGKIVLVFNYPVRAANVLTHFFLVPDGGSAIAGTFEWLLTNKKVAFTPNAALQPGTSYSFGLTAGVHKQDGTLCNWGETRGFTTGDRPVVLASSPGGSAVATGSNIVLTFDVPMHRLSVQNSLAIAPATPVTYVWTNGGKTLILRPQSALLPGTKYTVKVAAASRSAAGAQMKYAHTFSFTTAPAAAPRLAATAAVSAHGTVAITATLTAPAAIETTICNLAGRPIAMIPTQSLSAGVATLLWNGRSAAGTAVPAGMYLVKLTARSADGQTCSALVPLQR